MAGFMGIAVKVYDELLRLYPEPFRSAYRAEMRQIFQYRCDSIYHKQGWAALLRWWISCAGDLLINVTAERLHRMRHPQWWFGVLGGIGGLIAFAASNLLLAAVIALFSLFFLMPWELTLPPPGTLAETINNFFLDSLWAFAVPVLLAFGCEYLALRHYVKAQHFRIVRLFWTFALFNAVAAGSIVLLSTLGRVAAERFITDDPAALNDPNFNTTCLYGGLFLLAALYLLYLCLARIVPLSLNGRRESSEITS